MSTPYTTDIKNTHTRDRLISSSSPLFGHIQRITVAVHSRDARGRGGGRTGAGPWAGGRLAHRLAVGVERKGLLLASHLWFRTASRRLQNKSITIRRTLIYHTESARLVQCCLAVRMRTLPLSLSLLKTHFFT